MMGRVRRTIQQKLVLDAVKSLHNHPTMDQVYEEVRRLYPEIGKATVYRNLLQLSEEGKISSVTLPVSPMRYDERTSTHYHFRCRQCGDIMDVDADLENVFEGRIKVPPGISIEAFNIVFTGLCHRCNQTKDDQARMLQQGLREEL